LLINQGRGHYITDDDIEEEDDDTETRKKLKDVSVPIVCGYCFKTTIPHAGILGSP